MLYPNFLIQWLLHCHIDRILLNLIDTSRVPRNTSGTRGTHRTKVHGFCIRPISWFVVGWLLVFFIKDGNSKENLTFLVIWNVIVKCKAWKPYYLNTTLGQINHAKSLWNHENRKDQFQRCTLTFWKGFFIVNNFLNCKKTQKPVFIANSAQNTISLLFCNSLY